jgi:hypothetical protein
MAKTRRINLVTQGALAFLAAMAPNMAGAAPQRLDCVLTDIEIKSSGAKFDSQAGAEKRTVAVTFDDDSKKLTVSQGGIEKPLKNVAISQTSMTGAGDNFSIGIDRSSWRIVLQTYGQGTARNEFGDCSFRP